jgi:homopolymeric O-antigen transport system ATP-binding protein
MSYIAISVDHISKRFRIGKRIQATSRWKSLLKTFGSPFEYLFSSLREPTQEETLWALKDISFDVEQGEVVGVIGKNGAGKSTLLKILSRITEPTSGQALVYGRVGSLLEVGTGFHPELTGRENIYLNGTILGMKKIEIDRKFDQIVEFAEVEKFIDTQVKRYSSGMYVRLAFSVAAHLEPEILLIDEVLAVGDLSFQQKCLEHIKRLTTNGMTILLVSHNMAAIQSSCGRTIFINGGQIEAIGETLPVIEAYRSKLQQSKVDQETNLIPADQEQAVLITGFQMFNEDGACRREFRFGEKVRIQITLHARQRVERPMINFGIRRGDGVVVCNFNNWYDNFNIDYIEGDCLLEGWLPPLRLVPDFYEVHVLVWRWGGGHVTGSMNGARPLAWVSFGDFHLVGPALNAHDGVFQLPAQMWCFSRGSFSLQSNKITDESIYQVLPLIFNQDR